MDIDERTKEQARSCSSEERLDELIRDVKKKSARKYAAGETNAETNALDAPTCQRYKVF